MWSCTSLVSAVTLQCHVSCHWVTCVRYFISAEAESDERGLQQAMGDTVLTMNKL